MRHIITGIMIICILVAGGCRSVDDTDLVSHDIVKLTGFENTEYNLETDYQYYFNDYIDAVFAENGYYIVNDGILYFFDKDSNGTVPVCSKIDCNHISEDCDAYVGNIYCLSYYEQGLYYIMSEYNMMDNTTNYVLYRRALDGSVAEKLYKLATVSAGGSVIPEMVVHRGYVYYSVIENETECTLFRVPINGKGDIETLYTIEGYDAVVYKLKGYGDGITFIGSVALDSEYREFDYSLYYYDSNECEVKSVMEDGLIGEYLIYDSKIYYTLPDGIYCYDVIEDKDEKFCETDSLVYMSSDDNYFYFDNAFGIIRGTISEDNHKISVVNFDGDLIDTIDLDGVNLCMFGDRDYMFRESDNGFVMFDKSQIGTGSYDWIELLTKE